MLNNNFFFPSRTWNFYFTCSIHRTGALQSNRWCVEYFNTDRLSRCWNRCCCRCRGVPVLPPTPPPPPSSLLHSGGVINIKALRLFFLFSHSPLALSLSFFLYFSLSFFFSRFYFLSFSFGLGARLFTCTKKDKNMEKKKRIDETSYRAH